jgi:16S rRNA (uracil1498-N3)-methyltransferase
VKGPRVFVSPEEMTPNGVVFSDKTARYLRKVLRLKSGDLVEAFDGVRAYQVRLIASTRERTVGQVLASENPSPVGIQISLAFSCVRPGPVEQILRHGTELGVTQFIPLISARANRRPEERKDRWTAVVASASAQCGRTTVPAVDQPIALSDFLRRDFRQTTGLLLSVAPDAEPILRALHRTSPERAMILVGPEGGLEETEESEALRAGFHAVSLSSNILRSETAALVAIATVTTWHDSVLGRTR